MLCDDFLLVKLYIIGEVYSRLLGTEGFYVKVENENLLLRARVVVRSSKLKIPRRCLADYVKNCTKKRPARAARSFFLIQPITSLICGVVVAVACVVSSTL